MQTRLCLVAAGLAALLGLCDAALAQYGPPGGPMGYQQQMMGYPQQMGYQQQMPPMTMSSPYAMTGYQPMDPGMAPMGMPAAAPASAACGCGPSCGSNCGCNDCGGCCKGWCHKVNVFGEYLYLRARNAEVAYAVPFDGVLNPVGGQVTQTGPVELVDPDYSSGFRIGAGFTLNECNAIVVTYSQFDANTTDSVVLAGGGPDVLRSLVSSPNPLSAGSDGLDAFANLDIQFTTLDVDYKGLFAYCDDYKLNYVIGARYAQLEQHFDAQFSVIGTDRVQSDVLFDGGGLRLGLEGERYATNTGFFAYGKAAASFIGGEFRTRYQYGNLVNDPEITDTSWRAGRIVTITDLELGIGWRNYCDNLRLNLGYTYSCWHNVVVTKEWINAVQNNNFVDPSDNFNGMITFDGLTARVEVLW